jgi:signal transduction histidine kinase/ActR/RegA family two-component response regulator
MSWWRRAPLRPEVAAQLERIAFARLHVWLPFVMFAIVFSLAISVPIGIPVSPAIIFVNATMLSFAIVMYVAMRRSAIPNRYVHAVAALTWLLTPINTVSSYLITDSAELVLPLLIELLSAALMVDTIWTLIVTVPVVALGVPLASLVGDNAVYPISVIVGWALALAMQIWVRRWTITAETHRLDLETKAKQLERELDERKRAQAESEKLRDQFVHAQRLDAVGTLAAGLAHDMNNILGGILAFAEVLYAEAKDKGVKADLARIRQEAERGAALTRSLLAFSRRGAYRRRPILLHSVLDDMAPLLSRTLGKNITLERTDGPPTIIEGDPAQLGQVLLNLCLNAADAMSGTGTLTITTDEVELDPGELEALPPGRYAKLAIKDTGTGMDADTAKRAFEPFFTTKPVGKGTGLGLAMVFGAVQAHGGSIAVDTAPGQGTTMTIYIPSSEASPALPASDPLNKPRPRGVVLVVDDEPVVRTATARLVEQLGLTAVTAADGEQAVEVYKQRRQEIVLVLLDMVMPKLPGPDCYRALRKLGRTPVLLVSGYAADGAAQNLLETGADGFLEKPYTAEQLGTEIDRILGRAEPAQTTAH